MPSVTNDQQLAVEKMIDSKDPTIRCAGRLTATALAEEFTAWANAEFHRETEPADIVGGAAKVLAGLYANIVTVMIDPTVADVKSAPEIMEKLFVEYFQQAMSAFRPEPS